jgi:hypothetical protein
MTSAIASLCLAVASVPAWASATNWTPSAPILDLARRVLQQADHGHRAFAIVDKRAAVMAVYDGDGTLAGVSTVLLGRTPGDQSVPGVGHRTQLGQLQQVDLTTPAGRFDSQPGRNLSGEAVVWIDYGAALAIHRLRAGHSRIDRARRLASDDPRDKRISAGCVVVPEACVVSVVQPLVGLRQAVVYDKPEGQSVPPLDAAHVEHGADPASYALQNQVP